MERHAAELLRDALALPAEARAVLVDHLIQSLDQSIDEDAEEGWRQEIDVRLRQIDGGEVQPISWQAARRRLRDQLER
jgi:putative addiction module component (TIGR02574 family)